MRTIKILALLVLGFSTTAMAQNYWNSGTRGKGSAVQKKLDLPSITGLHLSMSAEVKISQGAQQSVEIKAQPNIIDLISTEVKNGRWDITFTEPVRGHGDIVIFLTVKDLQEIGLSGSGSVLGQNNFKNLGKVNLAISGSGNIQLDLQAQDLQCTLSGSGDLQLAGKTDRQEVTITGSGDVAAFDLAAGQATISITGSGDAEVNVKEQLEVAIVGSGDVHYRGNPTVRSNIIGSGDIFQK